MDTMAPSRPIVKRVQHIPLTAEPGAAAEARSRVRALIGAWGLPVDPSVAVLLISELVTNAIRHERGETVTVVVSCAWDELRVDVHDTSRAMPVLMDVAADAEAGRGLMLVATLASDWGWYPSLAGKAVYFTLALPAGTYPAGLNEDHERAPRGDRARVR
jgi:anti-sigma regulatory factor (Ser/Thr protein kinase)